MSFFEYKRWVAFCDTDAMAVVHHSNYVKYFEECRVAWMRAKNMEDTHFPEADVALAVIELKIIHHKPCAFGDELKIQMQVKRESLKLKFRYAIYSSSRDEMIASGETIHVPINKELRPVRLLPKFLEA